MAADLRALLGHPFELLLELEARLRSARRDAVADQTQAWTGLCFRLGERWLSAPGEEVREVMNVPGATRVPNARPWLLGIANVRGSLLTLIDLHMALGEPAVLATRATRVLVLNSERMPLGFVVDEVLGYRQFTAREQRPIDDPVTANYRLGAFEQQGRAWQAFSLHRLAQSDALKHAGRL